MVLDRARTASPAFTVMATAQAASNMTARPAAAFRTEEDDSRSIAGSISVQFRTPSPYTVIKNVTARQALWIHFGMMRACKESWSEHRSQDGDYFLAPERKWAPPARHREHAIEARWRK